MASNCLQIVRSSRLSVKWQIGRRKSDARRVLKYICGSKPVWPTFETQRARGPLHDRCRRGFMGAYCACKAGLHTVLDTKKCKADKDMHTKSRPSQVYIDLPWHPVGSFPIGAKVLDPAWIDIADVTTWIDACHESQADVSAARREREPFSPVLSSTSRTRA
jgi:hypothetical protein